MMSRIAAESATTEMQDHEIVSMRRFVTANREALILGALAVLTTAVFWPGLQARFVGDSFNFAETVGTASFGKVLQGFVPTGETWYRPMTDLVFWVQFQLFGMEPLGYHLLLLLRHLGSGLLLYLIARRLTGGNVWAAGVGAAVFLLGIPAHEVVYDASIGHNATSGVTFLACIYAYLVGKRGLAVVLAVITFSVDETGVLLLPLLAVYEGLFNVWGADTAGRNSKRSDVLRKVRQASIRVAPFAAVLVGYVIVRYTLAGGQFYNETEPCHSLKCMATGLAEYLNRLFVRPESMLALIWDNRPVFAAAGAVILGGAVLVMRPWAWRNWRGVLFAVAWVVGTVFYHILTLWEYISDRFLYVAYMGLGLLVALIGAEAMRLWGSEGVRWRIAQAGVGIAFTAWLLVGGRMLAERGELWVQAGIQAQSLVEQVHTLVPNPPRDTLFVISHVPGEYRQEIPPGNTGPHVFNNGMDAALRLRYGRSDLTMSKFESYNGAGVPAKGTPGVIFLSIDGDRVTMLDR